MEEKRRDTASSPAGPSSAEMDSASTRRRAGALKRKANSQSASNSSPALSKRITRDKSSLILQPQVNHNGPLTRARHGTPSNLDPASPLGSGVTKLEELVLVKEVSRNDDSEDLNKASEQWEALEAKIETEFEAIRSRDTNAHVVPNHCGWFSWTKTHPLEEQMLPSFFNGKTATRNPDMYLEIRNWIVKKFHANPNVQIEQKDLLELEVGDLDARLEVMEFLDYWGLINFHPFPPVDSAMPAANGDNKKDYLVEKLYHFEVMESGPPTFCQPHLASPVPSSRFLPESALAEELGRAEGPSVEYHCNSCSGDCSRKRFHCQKQADFDLCTECFNNGKFGSDMSSSDFILMESAEAPGVSSGKWTDQETLLLLEALELFKENWNEIAEHVATKTKAQCILHFVQMPIEDTFLDCDDEMDTNSKETTGSAAATDEAPVPEDGLQTLESKSNPNDGQVQASIADTSKTKDASEVQVSQEASQCENEVEVKASPEKSKLGDANQLKVVSENNENVALKALREALEAVGYQLAPESTLSFADVGNPVMALAGFLTKLVEPDIATASARNSLKSVSSNSPGLLLAAKHCFVLEDSPTDKKEPASESVVDEKADQDVQKEEPQQDKSDKDNNGGNSSEIDRNHDAEVCTSTVSSVDDQPTEKKDPSIVAVDNLVKSSNIDDSNGSESQKDHEPCPMNNSDDPESQVLPSSAKDSEGADRSIPESSQSAEGSKNKEMIDSLPSGAGGARKAAASKPDGETSEAAEALDKNTNTDQQQEQLNSNSASALSQSAAALKDEEMLDGSLPSERKKAPHSDVTSLVKQNGTSSEGKAENCDSEETKDGCDSNKLKRAAVTALSAAAVKAKLLAEQEEDQIRQLATLLIEKQLHKLETKLAFFNEMECVMMRVKEQLERSKQKLYQERAQIIAARLGLPAASSRPMPSSTPANRIAANFANAFPRPFMGMTAPRPPLSRPMGPMAPMPSNPLATTLGSGSSIRNASQDSPSSVVTK